MAKQQTAGGGGGGRPTVAAPRSGVYQTARPPHGKQKEGKGGRETRNAKPGARKEGARQQRRNKGGGNSEQGKMPPRTEMLRAVTVEYEPLYALNGTNKRRQ